MNASQTSSGDDEPLKDGGSLRAFLFTIRKAHVDLEGEKTASDRFLQVRTRGHARAYINELMPRLLDERERRRAARARKQ